MLDADIFWSLLFGVLLALAITFPLNVTLGTLIYLAVIRDFTG
ncbi:MAG: hypothetical protein AAGB22_05045 [Bacteroidota bacterium]